MGTTLTHKPYDVKATTFLNEQLTWDNARCTQRVLASTIVRLSYYYAAVERVVKATGERTVWAAIYKVGFAPHDYHNFSFKDMDESCGVFDATDCPARILDLLTPTDDATSNEWRAACRDRIAGRAKRPKIVQGTVIQFGRPLSFGGGEELSTFVYTGKGNRFTVPGRYATYLIRRWRDREFAVLPSFPNAVGSYTRLD